MSAWVWALIEKGTSWTVDARLVAVTMISPWPSAWASLGGWLAACAALSAAVCAKAGAVNTHAEVLISKAAEMRMMKPPFVMCLLADLCRKQRGCGSALGCRVTFGAALLHYCYRCDTFTPNGKSDGGGGFENRVLSREKHVADDFRLLLKAVAVERLPARL